eukprot:2992997-Rhodomonas_salina.1
MTESYARERGGEGTGAGAERSGRTGLGWKRRLALDDQMIRVVAKVRVFPAVPERSSTNNSALGRDKMQSVMLWADLHHASH